MRTKMLQETIFNRELIRAVFDGCDCEVLNFQSRLKITLLRKKDPLCTDKKSRSFSDLFDRIMKWATTAKPFKSNDNEQVIVVMPSHNRQSYSEKL